jgi:Zn-dependent peptidase ImmA (M78 family)
MSLVGKRKGKPLTRFQFENIIKKFMVFLKKELRITDEIPVVLIDDLEFSLKNHSFACIKPDTRMIYLSIINRHPIDILRSLAHEVVHLKQLSSGQHVSGHTGSRHENEANAKAGEILRKYGKLNPYLFDFMPLR